jgi:hypothetical protein
MGLSEAFYIPTALALIADHHSSATRSRAVGIHQIGIYLGVMLGSLGGFIADAPTLGWRWCFSTIGLVGAAYAVPLFFLLAEPSGRKARSRGGAESPLASWAALLRNPSFRLLLASFTLPSIAGWVVRDWMPSVLQKDLGLTQGLAGVSAVIWWQAAAIGSAILGGWLADRWMRSTDRGRIYVSALGMAAIVPALNRTTPLPATPPEDPGISVPTVLLALDEGHTTESVAPTDSFTAPEQAVPVDFDEDAPTRALPSPGLDAAVLDEESATRAEAVSPAVALAAEQAAIAAQTRADAASLPAALPRLRPPGPLPAASGAAPSGLPPLPTSLTRPAAPPSVSTPWRIWALGLALALVGGVALGYLFGG